MNKSSKAGVAFRRQETQYSCCAASIAAALKAHGKDVTEAGLNKVLGASPMGGATWEAMLATVQYFGLRGTLVVPSTIAQLKTWTDAGIPVIIAWNPEGRPWSHASCVFDVDDDHTVHIMDPNIPDPNETVRIVPKAEFYSKWGEAIGDNLIVRRPAMAIEREITVDGRQVQAGKKELRSMKDRGMSRFLKNGPVRPEDKSDATHAMDKAQWEIRKDMGMAGLPGAGMGAGLHKDKSMYDRKRERSFDREATLTQPLMTRHDYGATPMLNTTNFQRILKMAADLPGPVEGYVQEVQDANPDYTEGQAWGTAWSIYCVAGTTQVFTSMGLVTVGEIAKRAIMSKVGHGGVTAGEIQTILTTHRGQGVSSHVVNTGVKPVVTLTTKHGYTLTCTPDHRILALNTKTYAVEWVPAGECGGRYLVLPTHGTWGTQVNLSGDTFTKKMHNNVVPLRRPTTMTRDLARVLGYLVAEGSVTEDGVEFSNSDPKVVEDYTRCMMALFGEAPKVIWTQPSESNRYTKPAAKARSRTRWYRDFFSNLGLAPCVASEKVVPTTILTAPKEFVTEFLRAFTEGDGFVGDAQHPNRVDLSTASKTLAGQLHLILSNLGILATLEVNQKGYYTVRVNSALMARKFRDVVGGVFKTPTITDTNGRGSEFECIPAEGIKSLHRKIANKIPGTERISLSRIKALWGVLESYGDRATLTNLRDLVDNGYMFDPVEAVCDAGDAEVFDLSVPGDESFVANGLIAHNCKYKNPGSEHCQKSPSEYFKAAAQKIAAETRVPVKLLTPALKAALKALRYSKRDISVQVSPTYSVYWPGDDGSRGFFQLVGLSPTPVIRGAFGGGALGAKVQSPVDSDQSLKPLPPGSVALKGQEGSVVYATLTAASMADVLGTPGKTGGMSKKAGYTHYWEIKAVPTPFEWAHLMSATKKILAGAKKAGIVVRGGMGTGAPEVKVDGIWLNGDEQTGEDYETFNLEPQVDTNFCKTEHRPYDDVVVSILAAAKVILGKKIVVSSDGGPSAIRRVLGGDLTAKFEKGVSMTVDEVAEVVGPEFKEMNENPPPSVVKVMEGMQAKSAGSTHLSIDMFADLLKDSKFEKGVPVPVTELPDELQDNVNDPPPSVKKLTEELKSKTAAVPEGVRRALIRLYRQDVRDFGDPPKNHKSYGAKSSGFTSRVTIPMHRDGLVESDSFIDGAPINVKLTQKGSDLARTLLDEMQGKQAGELSLDLFAETLKEAKFEEGEPADPTENMSPEDAAEWHRQNDEHKDEFKGASTPAQRSDDENNAVVENFFHKSADVSDLWVGWIEDPEGYMARFIPPTPRGAVKRQILRAVNDVGLDLDWTVMNAGKALKTNLDPGSISPQWFSRLPSEDKSELRAFLDMAPGRAASKTAATGLYGFNKATEGACGAGVNKLQKAAKKIASTLYAKDEGSPSFLTKHAAKGGSKTASMLLKAMESIGPMAQINKTAGRSGTGLYGFSEKTAKLGLAACNDLHHEAGVIAGDLFARKGADPVKVAGYLASHAKKAKCPYAALLGECAPDAPSVVAKKTATDFLASDEEDDVEGNEEVLDIVSKC